MSTVNAPSTTPLETRFAELDATCDAVWQRTRASRYYQAILTGTITRGILLRYLIETYHYVCHNARNQALVIQRLGPDQAEYAKYCLKHAMEENGHEQMCVHDLRRAGFDPALLRHMRPLPATAGFIGFLYNQVQLGNPVARLGYSYFAEGAHTYLAESIALVKKIFAVGDQDMTFFVAHGEIDERHFAEVKQALAAHCVTDRDWEDVKYMITCVGALSYHMIDEIYENPLGE